MQHVTFVLRTHRSNSGSSVRIKGKLSDLLHSALCAFKVRREAGTTADEQHKRKATVLALLRPGCSEAHSLPPAAAELLRFVSAKSVSCCVHVNTDVRMQGWHPRHRNEEPLKTGSTMQGCGNGQVLQPSCTAATNHAQHYALSGVVFSVAPRPPSVCVNHGYK